MHANQTLIVLIHYFLKVGQSQSIRRLDQDLFEEVKSSLFNTYPLRLFGEVSIDTSLGGR